LLSVRSLSSGRLQVCEPAGTGAVKPGTLLAGRDQFVFHPMTTRGGDPSGSAGVVGAKKGAAPGR
jgi:hypothetical protein